MTGLIDWASGGLAANPWLVAALALGLAAAEGVIVLGVLVPGTTIILALAAAAGASGHGLAWVLAGTVAGAALGDAASFWLGRRHGADLARWGPIARRPGLMAAGEDYIRRRGATAVFTARFVPGVRTVVPTMAGVLGMPAGRFAMANVASAAVWSAAHVLGAGLGGDLLARVGGRTAAALLGALLVLGLLAWAMRVSALALASWAAALRRRAHAGLAPRRDPASRALARALDPDDPSVALALLWTALALGAAVAFAGLAEDVATGDPIVVADLALSRWLQDWRTPGLDRAMVAVTMLGDHEVLTVTALGAGAWLAWRRAWRALGAGALAMALTAAFVPLAKTALGRARPVADLYAGADAFAFPSGHATGTAVLAGLLAVLLARGLRWRAGAAVAGALGALALAVALSRVVLGAHWPSDVAAGLAFGAALSAAFALALGRRGPEIRPLGLALAAGGAFALAAAYHLPRERAAALALYAPRDLAIAMTDDAWRSGGWREVAPGRVDFEGEVEAPFVLQWAGDPAPLAAHLSATGWTRAPAWRPAALRGVFGATPMKRLTPSPELHLGRAPVAVWTRPLPTPDARLVLRLWPSRFTVGGARLLAGAIERETAWRPLGLLTLADDDDPGSAARDALRADLLGAPLPAGRLILPGAGGRSAAADG